MSRKTKSRNILIRNLGKNIIKKLDAIKKDNNIKTDTKTTIFLIDNWKEMKNELEKVKEKLEKASAASEFMYQLLDDIHTSNNKLNDFFKK